MAKKKKSKSSPVYKALAALCTFLGLVLAVLIVISTYAKGLLNKINYVDPGQEATMSSQEASAYLETLETDPDATGPVMQDEELDWGDDPTTQLGKSDNVVNILLVGQDARPGEGRSRSDVMILCTFNKQTKTLTMTSFLRDLYVQIPGYSNSKLNHTYVWGGMDLLNQTLEYNFGIHVDGNLEVNFEGFAGLIDLLGGVDMELRNDEANYINGKLGYYSLTGGMQHLSGEQALWYARIRALDADADFSRTNRQRKLLTALFEQFKNSDVSTLMALMEEAMPLITTNMSQSELLSYAAELAPLLADTTLVSQRIPADGTYTLPTVNGMSVIKADMNAARELLEDTLGE